MHVKEEILHNCCPATVAWSLGILPVFSKTPLTKPQSVLLYPQKDVSDVIMPCSSCIMKNLTGLS